MHKDKNNDRLNRQRLEQLLQHEVSPVEPQTTGLVTRIQKAWQGLQGRWQDAIAALTRDSKILNQPRRPHQQSGDFSYWYNYSWQAWVYSRLEDNPEEGRGWLEQVYRRSKSEQ